MKRKEKTLCFVIILLIVGLQGFSQSTLQYIGKTIYPDSIFYRDAYALQFSEGMVDSLLTGASSPNEQFYLLYIKALHQRNAGNLEFHSRLLDSCLVLLPKQKSNAFEASVIYIQRGIYCNRIGKNEEALSDFLKADSLALIHEEPNNITRIQLNIADFFREKNKLSISLEVLKRTEEYIPRVNDRLRLRYYIQLTSVNSQYGVYTQNKTYSYKANHIIDSLLVNADFKPFPGLYGMALAEKGALTSLLKDPYEAIFYFEKARNIFLELNDSASAFNQSINILHAYYNAGNFDKVLQIGEEILPYFQRLGVGERKLEIYDKMSEGYANTGEYKKAYEYMRMFYGEIETRHRISYSKDMEELETKYQTAQTETELNQANTEKERKSRQLNLLAGVVILVTLLLLVVIVLAFQFNLARRRIIEQAAQLEENNRLLKETLDEKDFLFKELHHRVKNNLQMITSFMKLQQKYATGSVESFVNEMDLRINAMSLVHEQLYKGTTHEFISLKNYLTDISGFILDSTANNEIPVESDVEGDELEVTLDTAVPVGLIVNEIITNTVKHAFKNRPEEPMITISLRKQANYFTIKVADNGVGFPSRFDPERTESLGAKAILLLTRQMKGQAKWYNENGAVWEILIPVK